jgi:[acyl-carrier-protein] S-malonyltransferase
MIAIVAPGQGAQTPGFLIPWLDIPGVADRLAAWSDLAGCDLIRYGTTAGADEIKDTSIAQPLLVAAGLATAEAAFGELSSLPGQADLTAGHSVGELTAGALAGVLTVAETMRLVRVRGSAMAAAAAMTPTGMTAVLGGDEAEVLAAIDKQGLTPANVNGAGQIVAAGTMDQLAAFALDPPAKARLRTLQVAGAFHTRHMAPAVDALRAAAADLTAADPAMTLLSDADGAAVPTGADWLNRIINQVSAPVRWDECMRSMSRLGVTAIIELPPAGTLIGLARRMLPGVALLALKSPDQLADARALVAEHGPARRTENSASQHRASQDRTSQDRTNEHRASDNRAHAEGHHPGADSHHPDWRLLVAPLAGTFRAGAADGADGQAAPGTFVAAGAELGLIEARGDRRPVSPEYSGAIIEWLVEDGDPVSAGQPIARLQPETSEQRAG